MTDHGDKKMPEAQESTLVSTMGGQAQVVTFALDALLAQGERVRQVVVLHLSPRADPRVARALAQLAAEFTGDRYAGRPCTFRPRPLRGRGRPLDDIRDEGAADATWGAVHALISELKAQGQHLHLCIAGGRRILGLLATSAAMLHFGHCDRLWHLYTPRAFLQRARDGAILHARPEDGVRLVRVPMMPWGAYFPVLRSLAQSPPAEVLAAQGRMMDTAERARCRQVTEALTPRQAEVLHAFAAGGSPQDVAEWLNISLKTVDSHKTAILACCRNAWGLSEETWLDYHFLRERFHRFFEPTQEPSI
jgi:CRISPR-associated protein Csx14